MTSNVLPFAPPLVKRDYTSLQSKVETYQLVIRKWSEHLDGNEIVLLLQIVDRTIGWGVQEVSFTSTSLREGDDMYCGVEKAISRRTMFRALASLEDRGFIRRRPDPRNRDKIHYSVNVDWTPEMSLNLPKRLRQGASTPCHSDTTPCHGDTDPCHSGTLYTGSPSQVSSTGSQAAPSASPPAPLDYQPEISPEVNPAIRLRSVATAAAAANRAAHTAKLSHASAAVSVEAAWRAGMVAAFPNDAYTAFGKREQGQAKVAARKWINARQIAFPAFVEWSVTNWTAIMRQQFKWMTKSPPPTIPAFSFFIAMIDQFADCWAERRLEEWLTERDRSELDKLKARGKTYEQAISIIAENKATVALRTEMEQREDAARRKQQIADGKIQQAKKLAEFGSAPMHPLSPAARKPITRSPVKHIPDDQLSDLSGVPILDPNWTPFD